MLVEADTPVLDSFADVMPAQTPANFTFPAHQAFFVGILPNAIDDLPFYNRFRKQLLGLVEVGETNVARHALMTVASPGNLLTGLRSAGYQVVGAGATGSSASSSSFSSSTFFSRQISRTVLPVRALSLAISAARS